MNIMLKMLSYSTKSDLFYSMVTPLIVLIGALFFVNYISITGGSTNGSTSIFAYLIGLVCLVFFNPIYVFIYGFIMHIDMFSCFYFSGTKLLTLITMFIVFFLKPDLLFWVLKNKKIKTLTLLALLFGIYGIIVNIGFNDQLSFVNISSRVGNLLGYLTIVPGYYFARSQSKKLFIALTIIAVLFLFVYYINFMLGTNLFNLITIDKGGASLSITRSYGYDVRQIVIFFFYLIPAIIISKNIRTYFKPLLILIGLFAYMVLVLAIYRLAMFYVAIGTILSALFIYRYVKSLELFKIIIISLVIFAVLSFFFSEYLGNIGKVITWTYNSFFGNVVDDSAGDRVDYQLPILSNLFALNPWIGCGIIKLISMEKMGMFGFVDIPILGTLTAFGILGMLIYYFKFYVLLSDNKISKTVYNKQFFNSRPFILYMYLTLQAYIITMITFRLFYISWELTLDYQQAEFGLISGAYIALHTILNKQQYLVCSKLKYNEPDYGICN